MTQKLIDTLERDIRNQVVIDQLKRLTWKDRFMIHVHANARRGMIIMMLVIWFAAGMMIKAAFSTECPTPGEKCKVIFLTEQEEKMLMGQNGILDTAAQARALDLGQFAVYLKTRINGSPQGEVKEGEKPTAPVDKK